MANDIAQSKDTAISGEQVSDISTYLSRAKKETGLDDFGGEESVSYTHLTLPTTPYV